MRNLFDCFACCIITFVCASFRLSVLKSLSLIAVFGPFFFFFFGGGGDRVLPDHIYLLSFF